MPRVDGVEAASVLGMLEVGLRSYGSLNVPVPVPAALAAVSTPASGNVSDNLNAFRSEGKPFLVYSSSARSHRLLAGTGAIGGGAIRLGICTMSSGATYGYYMAT